MSSATFTRQLDCRVGRTQRPPRDGEPFDPGTRGRPSATLRSRRSGVSIAVEQRGGPSGHRPQGCRRGWFAAAAGIRAAATRITTMPPIIARTVVEVMQHSRGVGTGRVAGAIIHLGAVMLRRFRLCCRRDHKLNYPVGSGPDGACEGRSWAWARRSLTRRPFADRLEELLAVSGLTQKQAVSRASERERRQQERNGRRHNQTTEQRLSAWKKGDNLPPRTHCRSWSGC